MQPWNWRYGGNETPQRLYVHARGGGDRNPGLYASCQWKPEPGWLLYLEVWAYKVIAGLGLRR